MENEVLGAVAETDFSLIALFMRASPVVKAVMVVLALASIWSWAVILQKLIDFTRIRRAMRLFESAFWSGQPLDELYERIDNRPRGAAETVFHAGMREWRRSYRSNGEPLEGSQERIDRALHLAVDREADKMAGGLGILATIGATAPFIGLFGTVWGIKNAFEGIAAQQSANLAVVAPGIAEALLATALGLLAALPAVIFYNKLSSDADRIESRMGYFADEFGTIMSRQMGRGGGDAA